MKKAFYILILFSLSRQASGQTNLVLNPSFENYTVCPSATGAEINKIVDWDTCRASPDYFNQCGTTSLIQVPKNYFGYQIAANGEAYCGFFTYSQSGFYREHLIGKLSSPLVVSQKYFVSFKVSRADSNYTVGFSSNKIGATFTKIKQGYSAINNFAHIYTNAIITDTINWTKISGSFIADSAYQYIMLGNFFDDANTSIFNHGNGVIAYYYIDEICVSSDSTFTENYNTGIINNSKDESLSIFPNPTSDFITINFGQTKYIDLVLFNKYGQTVLIKAVNASSKIDISNLPDGLYFIKAYVDNKIYHDKIIIRH